MAKSPEKIWNCLFKGLGQRKMLHVVSGVDGKLASFVIKIAPAFVTLASLCMGLPGLFFWRFHAPSTDRFSEFWHRVALMSQPRFELFLSKGPMSNFPTPNFRSTVFVKSIYSQAQIHQPHCPTAFLVASFFFPTFLLSRNATDSRLFRGF